MVLRPGALPPGAACSISALISPPTSRHNPVRYNQVRKTITAPILPYVLLGPKAADIQRKAERGEQDRQDRKDRPRRDPLPLLLDIGRKIVHQRQRHDEEPRADRPAQNIPQDFKDSTEAHESS